MTSRLVAILIALAVLAGGASIYLLRDESKSSANVSALGQALFPQLKAADVTRITIAEADATLNLEKKGGIWVITERNGYPADLDRVSELVVKILELKTGQSEPIAEKERARMQLAPPGKGEGAATLLTFKAQDGKAVAELLVGKKYFRNPPDGDAAAKALGDGRFVMLPGDPTRVIIVSDPLKQATAKAAEWIAREGFAIDNIKSLTVRLADGGFSLARDSMDAQWVLDGAGGELDQSRANSVVYGLSKLEIADLAAGADSGFEQGAQLTAKTFDGLEYKLKTGRLEKESYIVQVSVDGAPSRTGRAAPANEKPEDKVKREKSAADEQKALADRVTREKALEPFNVLIAKAKLDAVLKNRPDLLKVPEKSEEKK